MTGSGTVASRVGLMKERIRVLRKRRRPGHTPPAHGEARRVYRTAPITGRQRGPVTVRQMTAPPETTSAGPPHGACSSRQHFPEHRGQIPQSSLSRLGYLRRARGSSRIRSNTRAKPWLCLERLPCIGGNRKSLSQTSRKLLSSDALDSTRAIQRKDEANQRKHEHAAGGPISK